MLDIFVPLYEYVALTSWMDLHLVGETDVDHRSDH